MAASGSRAGSRLPSQRFFSFELELAGADVCSAGTRHSSRLQSTRQMQRRLGQFRLEDDFRDRGQIGYQVIRRMMKDCRVILVGGSGNRERIGWRPPLNPATQLARMRARAKRPLAPRGPTFIASIGRSHDSGPLFSVRVHEAVDSRASRQKGPSFADPIHRSKPRVLLLHHSTPWPSGPLGLVGPVHVLLQEPADRISYLLWITGGRS